MTTPVSRIESLRAYQRAPLAAGVTLRLDANEGQPAALNIALDALRDGGADLFRRYPDTRPLEAKLAAHHDVDVAQVFVSAGADDVIDRCCRAYLTSGSRLLVAAPGFEMFDHYAVLAGANVSKVAWRPGAYPIDDMIAAITADTRVIALISPNNPTGEVATADDLGRLSRAAPGALVILDHAYADFADEDLTSPALSMPNVVVVRTFSKAWGLAGCRVGYAVGPQAVIRPLRAAGGPFPASALSLAVVEALVDHGTAARDAFVARIREERTQLYDLLAALGGNPRRSQGNFVFAELGAQTLVVQQRLVEAAVLVRTVVSAGAPLGLRITLPGDPQGFVQLVAAVRSALRAGASQ